MTPEAPALIPRVGDAGDPLPDPAGETNVSLGPAAALVLVATALRLAWVIWTPYELIEDEAQYWLWAQHLDWSYYSKGPGIAWAIRLSTALFGDAEWAVRLPAVAASAIAALAVGALARDAAAKAWQPGAASPARVAVFAVLTFLLVPAFLLTSWLVTIDGAYVACWAAACWAFWRATEHRSRGAWLVLGAALGLGFLFKYTILLLIPGLLGAALCRRPAALAQTWKRWALVGSLLFALGLAPVLWWNWRQGWPTVAHLLGHLGASGGDMPVSHEPWQAKWTVEFVAAQIAIIGPALVLSCLAAAHAIRTRRSRPRAWSGRAFLLCAAAPILLFYLGVTFVAEPEQNWALAGYVTLIALAGWHAADATSRSDGAPSPRPHRASRVLWRMGLAYGAVFVLLAARGDWTAAAINRILAWEPVRSRLEAADRAPRRPITLGRLMGAKAMGRDVRAIAERLRDRTGLAPFVVAQHYGRASHLAYYAAGPGHEGGPIDLPVLAPGPLLGSRRTQFDFWPHASMSRPDLLGRPAILLSNDSPGMLAAWRELFESVEPADADGRLAGEHKKDRVAYIGLGYKGPPRREPAGERGGEQQ